MFIRHLSYFVTLAREMHFARAAEACHISQPILSAAIRKLEEDLEFRLVVRAHRFLGLTAEGERVLAWAQQMLNDYDGLRIDLSGLRCGLTGSLRLGVIPAAMPLVILCDSLIFFCPPRSNLRGDVHDVTGNSERTRRL